jgi:hypothetical protein
MKEISAALVKAQTEFGPALKTHTNPAFRSKYADLSACIEAVIDALNSNKIFLMQPTHLCDNGVIVETIFIHASGEQMSGGKLHVPATKHDAQGYGSALSYARRYSLMASCGIAPEEDDGNAAVRKPEKKPDPKPEPKPEPIPPKMEGKPGPWQLIISTDYGNDSEGWTELVCEAAEIQLKNVSSAADVTSIFTVNREIFNQLKTLSQYKYDGLMDVFKQAKAQYK